MQKLLHFHPFCAILSRPHKRVRAGYFESADNSIRAVAVPGKMLRPAYDRSSAISPGQVNIRSVYKQSQACKKRAPGSLRRGGILSKSLTANYVEAERAKQKALRPREFIFCERSNGAPRFRVTAGPKGELPSEEAASLLAIHCLARGLSPDDYEVHVVPDRDLIGDVKTRTQQLLAAGQATLPVAMGPREREVLNGVLENLSNKEIASRLNLSVRTIKFHVSSLLMKFGVRDRIGLIREAVLGIMPTSSPGRSTLFGFPVRRPDPISPPAALAVPVIEMAQRRSRG